jgi:dihydroorotase
MSRRARRKEAAMVDRFDLILHGGTLVNHDGIGQRDLGVSGGRFAAIGDLSAAVAAQRLNCTGLCLLPGVIDTQVHFREPGDVHKEDLETGSHAAVMGGVTAVFEMPNTNPATTNAAALADKIARAHHRMHCDFAFWIGGTHSNVAEIAALERLPGAAGIKVFMGSSTGQLLVEDDVGVAALLAATRRRAAFHSEDENRLRARRSLRIEADPSSHSSWRDAAAARIATQRLVGLARQQQAKIHVLHVSTLDEMQFLVTHKDIASVEVTPHHLTFTTDDYRCLGSRVQMNPPIRDRLHQQGCWWGVRQGIADILGSDHAPHTLAEKQQPYPESPSGMTGVQTLVPIMLDHVHRGRLSLQRFVDMTSAGPARLFGIAGKGRIAVGYDADLTVVDLKRTATICDRWIVSRCGWTPYDGRKVAGWPVGTIIRGGLVMWEGALAQGGRGKAVRFL